MALVTMKLIVFIFIAYLSSMTFFSLWSEKAKPEITGTLRFAVNLSTGTDTLSPSVNNET